MDDLRSEFTKYAFSGTHYEMEQIKIYETRFQNLVKDEVKCVYLETASEKSEEATKPVGEDLKGLTCSFCRAEFSDVSKQREHYKLDWHRYNLKQNLLGKQPLTEEQFDEKTEDVSSISGSDSEKEDTLDTIASAQGKIFLENKDKQVFSIYRCLLFSKKEENLDLIYQRIKELSQTKKWCVLMLGGGHFAGAIFEMGVPVLHKTFHCYTVRAGQGGSQSSKDGKSGGSGQPKSAGASLRRYNEQSLIQHVRDIVETWRNDIQDCSLIVYRASGPYNNSVLFDGKPPLLERSDCRLRSIPFSTRRATFTEVKRVYDILTTVHVYGSLEQAMKQFAKYVETDSRRSKLKVASINRAKSREFSGRPLPTVLKSSSSSDVDTELLENLDKLMVEQLITHDHEVDLQERLQAFDDSLRTTDRQKVSKETPKKSRNKKAQEREEKRRKKTYELIREGNLVNFTTFVKDYVRTNCEPGSDSETAMRIVNEVLDENGNTLLHVASLHEKLEIVEYLLENDANPCSKNKKQQTPYAITQNKDVREVFKQFAQNNPQKYNYNKAQIPINTLTPEEIAEKKKQQRKIKKAKEKIKKEENKLKEKEEAEKRNFLQLSDREKRALAAERRIVNSAGVAISRCFLCGSDISGKVPFEYLQNRFCSTTCVKAHRASQPIVLS